MQTKQSENIFFSYILKNGDYLKHITDRFFNDEEFKLLLPKMRDFYERYKQCPSKKQAWEIVSLDAMLSDKLSYEKLEAIWNWDISSYDEAWMKETFEAWVEFKNLEFSIFDVVSYVKNEKINQDNIKDVIVKVKEMMVDRNSLDFSFNSGIDFFNADEHKEDPGTYIKTGINYLDMVLGGGWQRKALYVLAAPPKTGKCSVGSTNITIRNKKTGKIENIQIENFYKNLGGAANI